MATFHKNDGDLYQVIHSFFQIVKKPLD